MHSIALNLSCLFIKLKKNLVIRVKTVHVLIYYTYETKEHRKHTFIHLGKSVRSAIPQLTSYIITWLHPLSLENIRIICVNSCEVAWK